jgi:hypothetical protein
MTCSSGVKQNAPPVIGGASSVLEPGERQRFPAPDGDAPPCVVKEKKLK